MPKSSTDSARGHENAGTIRGSKAHAAHVARRYTIPKGYTYSLHTLCVPNNGNYTPTHRPTTAASSPLYPTSAKKSKFAGYSVTLSGVLPVQKHQKAGMEQSWRDVATVWSCQTACADMQWKRNNNQSHHGAWQSPESTPTICLCRNNSATSTLAKNRSTLKGSSTMQVLHNIYVTRDITPSLTCLTTKPVKTSHTPSTSSIFVTKTNRLNIMLYIYRQDCRRLT